MKLGSLAGKEKEVADIVVLLLTVCVALVTWSYVADAAGVAPWRLCASVGFTLLCALAALTRDPHRSAAIRLLLGGWLITAPYLLAFAAIAPVLWTYLAAGTELIAVSSYAIVRSFDRRLRDTMQQPTPEGVSA